MTDGCRPCVFIRAVLLLLPSVIMAHKPVIIVHGLLDGPAQFEALTNFINEVRIYLIDFALLMSLLYI